MTTVVRFAERLNSLGILAEVVDENIELRIDSSDIPLELEMPSEFATLTESFYNPDQFLFDESSKTLVASRSVEFQVLNLDSGYTYTPAFNFINEKGHSVYLGSASVEYLLSLFESEWYEKYYFSRVVKMLTRRIKNGGRPHQRLFVTNFDFLFPQVVTAKFKLARVDPNSNIEKTGLNTVKACLFSLAYKYNQSWEFASNVKFQGYYTPKIIDEDVSIEIPKASYNSSLVSYYKVAKSSIYPSQCFLSYYHILEYCFLRVADEQLFQAVKTKLNDPSFYPDYERVSSLLATIKKNDSSGDEKAMLRSVLSKYIDEEEFIDFVKNIEKEAGEKKYTGSNQKIFGEEFNLKLAKGHAVANFSNVLKHIRNCLVHSSDKYTREGTFLPLSSSEDLIVKYIPIIQYMAEKIIFTTAE